MIHFFKKPRTFLKKLRGKKLYIHISFKKQKNPINLGLIIVVFFASAITWGLSEFAVFQLHKINDNYEHVGLSIVEKIRPEAKAQSNPSSALITWLTDPSHADYTQTELFRDGYIDVQWFDGYRGYTVDSTGVSDSTLGIQACIDAVYNEQIRRHLRRVVLFTHQPNGAKGEYLISNYLNCRQGQPGRTSYAIMVRHALVGALNNNNERPLIKLGNSSPNYQNVNDPRPMVWYWSEDVVNDPGGTDPYYNDWDVNFRQTFRGIDLDLGNSNEGAIGIEFMAAEESTIEDTTITVRDGIAGIGDLTTYTSFAVNIEIIGGDYAVKNFSNILSQNRGFSQTMAGCKFTDQKIAVFDLDRQYGFLQLTGCHISNTGSVPLVSSFPVSSAAGIVLDRSLIEMGSNTTLIQDDLDRNIVIRDTYTKGINNIIAGGSAVITNTADYAHIKEYSRPGANDYLNFVDGALTGTIINIDEGQSYTQQSLIDSLVNASKWNEVTFPYYWNSNGGFRDSDVLNAQTECISEAGLAANVPVSFPYQPPVDATAALQAAIDWAATNNKILFLGRGMYHLTDTITLRPNSRIIGIDQESTVLLASPDWDPSGDTPIIQTDNNAVSSAVLAYLSIRHYAACLSEPTYKDTWSHVNFTNLDWQLGRNSQVRDVQLGTYLEGWCNLPADDKWIFRYNRAKVRNNGGGRWWNIGPNSETIVGSQTSIPYLIKDTDEPMYFYGKGGRARGNGYYGDIKIENSSNKYLYNNTLESTAISFYIEGSSNLVLMGGRQNNQPPSTQSGCWSPGVDAMNVVTDYNGNNSNNVFISSIQVTDYNAPCDYYLVKETYNGNSYDTGLGKRDLSVFKRGEAAYTPITAPTTPTTCASKGGTCCTAGQTCSGGAMQSASDCSGLCCVGGSCVSGVNLIPDTCNTLNHTKPVPNNFGASYDVFSPNKELLLNIDCRPTQANISIGNGSAYTYIWNKAYYWRNSAWEEVALTGTARVDWIIGSANGVIPGLNSSIYNNTNYYITYVCQWNGSAWQCGCSNPVCASKYWQQQRFGVAISCTDTDGDLYTAEPSSFGCGPVCGSGHDRECLGGSDCNDNRGYINPGAVETCDTFDNNCSDPVHTNGIDEDEIDEGCDDDEDGFCDDSMQMYNNNSMCTETEFVANEQWGDDCCDDDNCNNAFNINPDAEELCQNNIDDDCDGDVDEGCGSPTCTGCGITGSCSGGQTCNDSGACVLLNSGQSGCDCDENCSTNNCVSGDNTNYCCDAGEVWNGGCITPAVYWIEHDENTVDGRYRCHADFPSSTGVCSADDLLIIRGGLRGELRFRNFNGDGNYITIKNDPSRRVVIKSGDDGNGDGSGGGAGIGHLTIENCKYIDIRGDNLSTFAWARDCHTAGCYGIYVEQDGSEAREAGTTWIRGQSEHVKLSYVEITDNLSPSAVGIHMNDGNESNTWIWDTIELHHLYIHDILTCIYGGGNRALANDSPYTANLSFHDILCEDHIGSGLITKSQHPTSGTNYIYNNIVRRGQGNSGIRAIDIYGNAADRNKIYNNYVEDQWGNGIRVEVSDSEVYNNIIINVGHGDDGDGKWDPEHKWETQNYGIMQSGGVTNYNTVDIHHNTIINTPDGECIDGDSGEMYHYDNLGTNCNGGMLSGDAPEGTGAYANTYITNPADVKFVAWSDDGNYSNDNFDLLASSPTVDASGASGYPNRDYAGRSRPIGSAADDGAYEYTVVFSDTTFPEVTAHYLTYGSVISHFTVNDSGGSNLDRIELWRAPHNSSTCNNGTETTCDWNEVSGPRRIITDLNYDDYSSSITSSPSAATYWYGIHAVDQAGNCVTEQNKDCDWPYDQKPGDSHGPDKAIITTTCTLSPGDSDYCKLTACGPCSKGEDDCDIDSECQGDLVCVQRTGNDYCCDPGEIWDGGCTSGNGDVSYSELWGASGELWTPQSRLPDFSHAGYHGGDIPIPNNIPIVANVKDYGARGDGITDDTAAFNNAIQNMPEGALLIPQGRYFIGGFVIINRDNIVLRGEGREANDTVLYIANDMTTLEGRYAPAIFQQNAVITIGEYYRDHWGEYWQGPFIANVSREASRGDKYLYLSSVSGISAGDFIMLRLHEDSTKSLASHLYNDLAPAEDHDPDRILWPVKVVSINSSERRVELEQYLRFDVRSTWAPKVYEFTPMVKESGIENLRVECPDVQKMWHFHPPFNAINFRYALNSWTKNIAIKNCENSMIFTYTKYCTALDTELLPRSYNLWFDRNIPTGNPPPPELRAGHSGFTLKHFASENLISDFVITGKYFHDFTLAQSSTGNVIRNGKGVDINFDFHAYQAYENLLSNIHVGKGAGIYNSSGPSGVKSGVRNTFWNIRADGWNPDYYATSPFSPPTSPRFPQTNVIPCRTDKKTPDSEWYERMDGPVHPTDLYLSQLNRRLNRPQTSISSMTALEWTAPSLPPKPAAPSAGENLIVNSGFEDGISQWTGKNNETSDTVNIAYASIADKRSGYKSLVVIAANDEGSHAVSKNYFNYINSSNLDGLTSRGIVGGRSYDFEGWIKTVNVNKKAGITINQYDSNDNFIAGIGMGSTMSGSWTKISKTFTLDNNTAKIQIKCHLYSGSGTAYFDDLKLSF